MTLASEFKRLLIAGLLLLSFTLYGSEFLDEYSLYHCNPNEISENGALFTTEVLMLKSILGEDVSFHARTAAMNLWNFKEQRWQDRGGEAGLHVSLDNMVGIYILGILGNFKPWEYKSGLTKQVTHPNYFLHPKEFGLFAIIEGRWWGYLTMPLMTAQWLYALTTPRQDTSGKILWAVRWFAISKPLFYTHLRLLRFQYGDRPLRELYRIYFPHKAHPIHALVEKAGL